VASVFQDDGAATAPDKFEGEERETLAVNDEVRRAPLAAAADEGGGVGGVALLPIRVEEAPGAGDLAGEVVGVGVGGHGETGRRGDGETGECKQDACTTLVGRERGGRAGSRWVSLLGG
jgi:hypothetical protein